MPISQSEIQGWIWNAQSKIDNLKKIVKECDDKLARLEPVYKEFSSIKESFRSARKTTEAIFEEKGIWRGEKYNTFCNDGAALDDICGSYYSRLDFAHDAVNTKIGELRAKKYELIPIIGDLSAQISQWYVALQNAVN